MADYKNLSLQELLNYKDDPDSWYWLGMAYMENYDSNNVIKWLEKAMNNSGNEKQEKATQELAFLYLAEGHPKSDRDKALRLFEKVSSYAIPQIHIGLLYYHGTQTQHDPKKGKEFVEKGLSLLKQKGGLDYLNSYDLYHISTLYHGENDYKREKEYLQKAIKKSDLEGEVEAKKKYEKIYNEILEKEQESFLQQRQEDQRRLEDERLLWNQKGLCRFCGSKRSFWGKCKYQCLLSCINDNKTISFGRYKWRVLDLQNDKVLLIAEDVIEERYYDELQGIAWDDAFGEKGNKTISWEKCSLRRYLNGVFYNQFSYDEKLLIYPNQTSKQDKISLLSVDEAEKYYRNSNERIAKYKGNNYMWWLRMDEDYKSEAAHVYKDGRIVIRGNGLSDYKSAGFGVRPVIWLDCAELQTKKIK